MRSSMTFKSGLIVLAMCLLTPLTFAQPNQDNQTKKEKIEQLKIAFITKELDLTSEEAEKFWPAYNEMADALKEERKGRREISKDLKDNFDVLSDADIKKKANAVMDSEIKEAQLKKEHTEKIAGIIGYRKATKLLSLEQRFKRELLNKLKEQKGKPGPPQGRGPNGGRGPGSQR